MASVIATISLGSSVFAEEIKTESNYEADGWYLIDEKETVLEDGTLIVERLYCNIDLSLVSTQSFSGSRPISYEKSISTGMGTNQMLVAVIWVSGDFSWNNAANNTSATVTNVKYGNTPYNNCTYIATESSIDSKNNQGSDSAFGSKYAYIKYNAKFKTAGGGYVSGSIYLDCNVNGVSSCS